MSGEIEKQAAPGFAGKFLKPGAIKKAVQRAGNKATKPIGEAAEKLGPNKNTGQFIKNIQEQIPVSGNKVRMYTDDEIAKMRKQEIIEEGTNGLITDTLVGATKMVLPQKYKDKVDDGVAAFKSTIEKYDTKAATPIAGKNPGGLWGKFMSVPAGKDGRGFVVGETLDDNGKVIDHIYRGSGGESRRPSLLAPVQNTTKVVSPFLGAAYVTEKLYGDGAKKPNQEMNKASEIISSDSEKHGILEEDYLTLQMDKEASMLKTAQLEAELEKYASEVNELRGEKELLIKTASEERKAKEKFQTELHLANREFMDKKAEFEEFQLRTIARERSTSAIKLAESMLENGMIKQAEFDKQVDKLMDCDEETFNLYTSMSKRARNDEEGLESLAFMVDYRDNDINFTQQPLTPGFTKGGQSMGDAARELSLKR